MINQYDRSVGQIHVRDNAATEGVLWIVVRVDQVLSHDAIVDFTGLATPLPLYAGGFVALFIDTQVNNVGVCIT
jgi:hypothetical protein